MAVEPYTSKCLICNYAQHYFADGAGGCTKVVRENCVTQGSTGECTACATGYTLLGCSCVANRYSQAADCLRYSEPYSCSVCAGNAQPNLDGLCQAIPATQTITNCVAYGTQSNTPVCLTCAQGFYLLNNQCYATDNSHCAVASQPTCTACLAGYVLLSSGSATLAQSLLLALQTGATQTGGVYDVCVPAIPFCQQYQAAVSQTSATAVCLVCQFGYALYGTNQCLPVTGPIAGCTQYTTTTLSTATPTCVLCSTDPTQLVLLQNQCIENGLLLVPNCLYYSDASKCSVCEPNFYLDPTTNKCVAKTDVANCDRYTAAPNPVCQYCNADYILKDNACVKITDITANCVYLGPSGCAVCATGYYPDATTGICKNDKPAIAGCQYQSSATVCTNCLPEYYFVGGVCTLRGVPNCAIYNNAVTSCKYCDTGYYLAGTTCTLSPTTIEKCKYYTSPTVCAICVFTEDFYTYYFNAAEKKCKLMPPEECIHLTAFDICDQCKTGFYYSNSRCVPTTILPNCEIQQDASTCIRCKASFYLSGTVCVAVPTTSLVRNCAIYDSNAKCKYCRDNTFPVMSTTTPTAIASCAPNNTAPDPTMAPQYCLYQSSATTCAVCRLNYYLSAGNLCVRGFVQTYGCEAYNKDGICTLCTTNNYRTVDSGNQLSTFCKPLPASIFVDKCLSYLEQACEFCIEDYYLSTPTTCTPVESAKYLPFCLYHDTQDHCSMCQAGYFVNPTTFACDPVTTTVPNCAVYATATTCKYCATNYILQNNACVSINLADCLLRSTTLLCIVCAQATDYVAADGTCKNPATAVLHCAQYDANQKCVYCDENYYLSGTSCVLRSTKIDHCLVYATPTTCARCDSTTYLTSTNTVCSPVTPLIPGCQAYATATTCKICDATSLLLPTGLCALNCLELNAAKTACQYCAVGFYLQTSTKKCVATASPFVVVPHCAIYSPTDPTKCYQCEDGFYVDQNSACISDSLYVGSHCSAITTSTTCQICAAGYYFNDQKVCVLAPTGLSPNCAFFDQNARCIGCDANSYMDPLTGFCTAITAPNPACQCLQSLFAC